MFYHHKGIGAQRNDFILSVFKYFIYKGKKSSLSKLFLLNKIMLNKKSTMCTHGAFYLCCLKSLFK